MVITRTLYLRALGAVHCLAIGSFWWQAEALIGSAGILPFADHLAALELVLGPERYWQAPTLLWAWRSDLALHALCALGMVLGIALAGGVRREGPLLIGLYAVYVSIGTSGQTFLSFQWDTLLCEVTVAAVFVARFTATTSEPPRWAWWLQWWVLARLMFFGGLVKLTSGDPTWADGSALTYHFWTQPLPNPLSWWVDRLPAPLLTAGVWGMFVVELVLPFGIAMGRQARQVAFVGFVGLLGLLAATGNYGTFQLLSVALCLPLLDDRAWRRVLPARVLDRLPEPTERRGRSWGAPLAVAWVGLSLLWLPSYAGHLPGVSRAVLGQVSGLRLANRYGLFAVMTTERPEVILEGTDDGVTWTELHTRHKPGALDRHPAQLAPHMPRLDWQLWFAALGHCEGNRWVGQLMERVVHDPDAVAPLFAPGTFADGPPRAVRATRWQYRFAPPGSAATWVRDRPEPYCPAVVRRR